ncbi:MAG: hypothetical protein IT376_18480 [Polyangiaceae bacterium]|nr:hypothetical protein [Polyangiaceae bacterium]
MSALASSFVDLLAWLTAAPGQPTWLAQHWEAAYFQKDTFDPLMTGLRLFLTFGGAILLLLEARALRLRISMSVKWRRWVAILFTGLAFGVYFDFFNPNTRYIEYYHRHEFFHYYMGSKYFEEIGYNRLYECAAAAEMELGRAGVVQRRELRDLRENLIKKNTDPQIAQYISECKGIFLKSGGEPRWEEWKREVDWFYRSSAGSYWENMQKDHGYNPPPVWTMAGKFFGSFGTADDGFFKALSLIDIALHVGIVVLLYWAFGWRVGAVCTVWWGCNAPANFYWTGGAFMRQDWFFFVVAALCLAKKRRLALAGAALTWSALLRVFPAILFAGWGIMVLFHLFKERAFHPDHKRLIAGAAVALAVLVPASMLATGGSGSYKEFIQHTLVTHARTPLTNQMGLETNLVHTEKGRMRFTRDDNLDDPFKPWKEGRNERFKRIKPLFLAIVAFVGLWTAWALRRTKHLWIGLCLSLPLVMSLTNLTCYYYSMYIIAPALMVVRPGFGAVALVVSGASYVLYKSYYWVDDQFTGISWLFLLFSGLILYAYSRPFSVARLKAWLANAPEPHAPHAAPTDSSAAAAG